MAREIDPGSFIAAHANGAVVVDVREQYEYVSGHVPGAIWIPLGMLHQRMQELPKNAPVYVICASGNRSLLAADWMSRIGIEAYSVRGGMYAWQTSGRPVVYGANAA